MKSNENNNAKIFQSKIDFFVKNIKTLRNIKPALSFEIEEKNGILMKKFPSEDFHKRNEKTQLTITLNSSIVLNCFGLIESALEWKLLEELDTRGLSGVQEKVMQKYIDNVIRISNLDNYIKEYNFITGKKFKELFIDNTYSDFDDLKCFYSLRHILVHGSVTKQVFIPANIGGYIRIDNDDKDYVDFIENIKQKFNIKISNSNFDLETLLMINEIWDYLVKITYLCINQIAPKRAIKVLKEFPK